MFLELLATFGMAQGHNVPMDKLTVRPMTLREFDAFRSRTDREFAVEQVLAGNWTAEEAEALSAKYTDKLLPQGVETPGMLLLTAEISDGVVIGHVWVALEREPGSSAGAWIYEFEIDPEQRGKGYGRDLLRAAELETVKRGVSTIGLNVFGTNVAARNLYDSAGYQVTSTSMLKVLPPLG